MTKLLESTTRSEICEAMGGDEKLLDELRDKLLDWLALQPHLPKDVDARRIECFILNSKFSLELAKQKLDMYYTLRHHIPELFADRDPSGSNLTECLKSAQWICLPKLTPQKYRVSLFRICSEWPSHLQAWEFFKYCFMVGDIRHKECRAAGDVYIYDLAGARMSYLAKVTPSMLKKIEVTATTGYAAMIKNIHFLNAPSFLDHILFLIKSAIKPKLASRIHVHESIESLYEFVPKSVLPSDYGGEQPSTTELAEKWRKKMDEWRDWFVAQQNVKSNESLRPDKKFDADELFGIAGSFRQLLVD